VSVLTRKSLHDIGRRRARSLFTVATIAMAVAGLGLFGMPRLMDDAMAARLDEVQLHDVRFVTSDVVLDGADIERLEGIDGVRSVAARTVAVTRVFVGDRRDDVVLVGVADFGRQAVDIVTIDAGSAPAGDSVLNEAQNGRSGRLAAPTGTVLAVEDITGDLHEVEVSGQGGTLVYSQIATETAVLYAPQDLVNRLAGTRGVNSVELTVTDPVAAPVVAEEVRAVLVDIDPAIVFEDLPDVRAAGSWPGESDFDNFATLFYVGAVLALISAMVLISNTMTTIVAEQVREIAVMKAVGGRRRQIIRSFLSTVAMLAGAGAVVGALLSIVMANLLVGFVGREFFGIDPGWGVAVTATVVSFVIGVVGSVGAAMPALRRAARISVREGLDASSGLAPTGRLDRWLRGVSLPRNVAIGVRNLTRRRARTIGTTVQIGLAAGVAVGFLTLGVTIATVTGDVWDTMSWDVIVVQRGPVDLDDAAGTRLASLDGVDTLHPTLYNTLEVDGTQLESWGLPPDTDMFEPDILAGRWLAPSDSGQPVAVVGRALAATSNLSPGDILTVGTARGTAELEIVGVDSRLMNNGTTIYLPLASFQALLGRTDANTYWVRSVSQRPGDIDSLAAAAEDALGEDGYPVRTEIHHVEREANLASNRVLVNVLAVMGVPIVAIGMIGLVNLMTMNVIERTREIGILRCIGARSRDVRRIFRSEALAVAVAGWLLAVPLGWVIGRTLVWIITEIFNFGSVTYSYPLWYLPVTFVGTMLLAGGVVVLPVRRAARLQPGDALRYE
jgi:putative ABC transport system permease protein